MDTHVSVIRFFLNDTPAIFYFFSSVCIFDVLKILCNSVDLEHNKIDGLFV